MRKFHKLISAALVVTMTVSLLAGCGKSNSSSDEGDSAQEDTAAEAGAENEADTGAADVDDATKPTLDAVTETVQTELAAAVDTPVESMTVTLTSASFDTSPFSPPTPGLGPINYMIWAKLFFQTNAAGTLENGGMQPWVGKAVTKVDDFTYDVEIFDNVYDSQGNHITADDIIFSYEMSGKEGGFEDYSSVTESVTKIDDYNVEIKLKTNMVGVIEEVLSANQLFICSKEWYENTSGDERQTNPATTGAYMVKDVAQGSSVTLVRNEDPWQKEPTCSPQVANVNTIYYKVITEGSMRAIGLENKELDNAQIVATDLSKFYDEGARKALDGWSVFFSPATMVHCLFCNMDSGVSILADNLELRQAIFAALDSEEIYYGAGFDEVTAIKANALAAPSMGGYDEIADDSYLSADLETAKAYFEASGQPQGTEITLLSSQSLYTDAVRSVIIAQLEAVGFTVNSLAVDQALFNTYKNDSTQWDLIIDVKGSGTGHVVSLWNGLFDPSNYQNGSVCFTHDDKLIELLEAAKTDSSTENLKAFNDYISENAIAKGLYSSGQIYVTQSGITDIPMGTLLPLYGSCNFTSDYQSVVRN
ncbi:MAG: ABC transporter substrate-binding protein [Lachnospiraceae bacterium]|nr:ABC transporter substrate-binding protein [Lachnospiraceae bacterium]